MKRWTFPILFAAALALTPILAAQAPHDVLTAKDGQFQLGGKPFQIISGEVHYPRVPRPYWAARLKMAKAMGLNSVTAYVFWNFHEPKQGVYNFVGDHDVAEFVREAQRQGLYVLLRPGPYVCAEWDLGGYPAWMLQGHGLLRSQDPTHMAEVRKWLKRLGQELAPLQAANGGPIIGIQVENEYGSFGEDHDYMRAMRTALLDAGFDRTLLYTADGYEQLSKGSLPDMPAVINFAPGKARVAFAELSRVRPQGPYMAGEYWDGWFDHWGNKHADTNGKQQAEEIEWMLGQGYSLSIYMLHGGTSFGWMNGANSNPKRHDYAPDVTSYDYDAALSESGQVTPKFMLFREAIAKATHHPAPPIPAQPELQPAETQTATFEEAVSLWDALPKATHSALPLSMEDLKQPYGYALYRTTLKDAGRGTLAFDKLHDYAAVYLDGKLAGTVDRRLGQTSLSLDAPRPGMRLDVLVENTGRVNFSTAIRDEFTGIIGNVRLGEQVLHEWDIYSLPMEEVDKLPFTRKPCTGPCFFRSQLNIARKADTFLDTRQLGKGELFVNGFALGRFWSVGPQRTLYLPAPLQQTGPNRIVAFDIEGAPNRSIRGLATPILNAAVKDAAVKDAPLQTPP